MPFNLEELNAGTWFDINDDEKVCLRLCVGSVLRQIDQQTIKKCSKFVQLDPRQKPQRVEWDEIPDERERNAQIWDYSIMDWDVVQPGGEEIPCTKENKILLMEGSIEFSQFILDSLDLLRNDDEQKEKDLEKN